MAIGSRRLIYPAAIRPIGQTFLQATHRASAEMRRELSAPGTKRTLAGMLGDVRFQGQRRHSREVGRGLAKQE